MRATKYWLWQSVKVHTRVRLVLYTTLHQPVGTYSKIMQYITGSILAVHKTQPSPFFQPDQTAIFGSRQTLGGPSEHQSVRAQSGQEQLHVKSEERALCYPRDPPTRAAEPQALRPIASLLQVHVACSSGLSSAGHSHAHYVSSLEACARVQACDLHVICIWSRIGAARVGRGRAAIQAAGWWGIEEGGHQEKLRPKYGERGSSDGV